MQIKEQTSTIVLNSLGLKINSARVGDLESSSIVLNEEGETATLTFPKDIGAVGDEVTLALTFSGELDGNMRGYYKSKHEVDGKTQYVHHLNKNLFISVHYVNNHNNF